MNFESSLSYLNFEKNKIDLLLTPIQRYKEKYSSKRKVPEDLQSKLLITYLSYDGAYDDTVVIQLYDYKQTKIEAIISEEIWPQILSYHQKVVMKKTFPEKKKEITMLEIFDSIIIEEYRIKPLNFVPSIYPDFCYLENYIIITKFKIFEKKTYLIL